MIESPLEQYSRVAERQLAEARVEISRLKEAAAEVRRAALREAAGIADIWAKTVPNYEASSNFQLAKAFATVASDTGTKISAAILALIPPERLAAADDGGGK